ncbi:hypothetical protein OF83DRAFT_1110126 [Amylostereum chailletii]|nr:hypothetical protein OF83DRAFT_1110126 [Amylostereum chailletii]
MPRWGSARSDHHSCSFLLVLLSMSKPKFASTERFNAEHQLVYYGSFHSHPVNVAIHLVFIPIIFWSTQVLLAKIPVPYSLQLPSEFTHIISPNAVFIPNWAAFQTFTLFAYYFLLEPTAALLFVPALGLILTTATAYAEHPDTLGFAFILNILSWIAQFIGHGVAEKRAPAVTDNVAAALFLAPFFVHIEILFFFGYRRELYEKVQKGVKAELKKIHTGATGRKIDD